jgi:hypothetical protein
LRSKAKVEEQSKSGYEVRTSQNIVKVETKVEQRVNVREEREMIES